MTDQELRKAIALGKLEDALKGISTLLHAGSTSIFDKEELIKDNDGYKSLVIAGNEIEKVIESLKADLY